MGFLQHIYNNLKDQDYMGNWGKIRHSIKKHLNRVMYGTGPNSNVIFRPDNINPDLFEHIYAMRHESIHIQIAEKSFINIAYYEMRKIYQVLINCFLEQYSKELRIFCAKNGLIINRITHFSMKFLYENMSYFLQQMGKNKDLVAYCEYTLEYNKKCAALVEITQLIHEGTATWCALHHDYHNTVPEDKIDDFKVFLHNKEEELLSQESIHRKGYSIVNESTQTNNPEQLINIAVLSLSPPESFFEILRSKPQDIEQYIHQNWNCVEIWKKLLNGSCSSYDNQATNYQEIYRSFYGEPWLPLNDHFRWLWYDETTMDAIRLLYKKYTGNDIMEIVESEDYVPRKPMPYTETIRIIQNSPSESSYKNQTIKYYRSHQRTWGALWEENKESKIATEYDINERIHLDNITSMMEAIVAYSKEDTLDA